MNRYQPVLTALGLGVLALLVSGRSLQSAPVYLHHDETLYALHGYSIATTGHDLNGLRLPLFIHTFAWVPPIAIYARALMFLLFPVTEMTTRIPGVVIGAIDVVLTYVVARRLFRRESLAALAALLVILTPAHFIHARLATDHICGLPFFIASLWFLINFIERRTLGSLCAANVCLGLGIYGYNGAMTSMPVFAGLTWLLLFVVLKIRTPRPYLVAAGGFLLALLPLVPWLFMHPEQIADQFKSYQVFHPAGGAPGPGAASALYGAVLSRLDAYYHFFNPSLLFFTGDGSLLDSTGEVGVFLLPLAVLLPVGVAHILRHQKAAADRLVLMAFFAAPIGALIVAESKMTRALVMAPLAAFVAVHGFVALVGMRNRVWKVVAIGLLCAMPIQFQLFYRDYVGNYRERSAFWFEGNRAGAFESLIARAEATRSPVMYVSRDIPLVNFSWQLFAIERRRPELKDRVVYFDESLDLAAIPGGSVLLSAFDPGRDVMLDRWPALKRTTLVEDAGGHPSFAIYEK